MVGVGHGRGMGCHGREMGCHGREYQGSGVW